MKPKENNMFEKLKKLLESYMDNILIFNHGFAPVEKIDGNV